MSLNLYNLTSSLGLLSSGLWIALGIAGAELLYGIVKYTTAPTPEARREGLQELINMVYGAVFTVVMWYYMSEASIIAVQFAGLFGLGKYVPPSVDTGMKQIQSEELGTNGLIWEYTLIFIILAVLAELPYFHTFSAVVNNYTQFFIDALKYTILNGVALYAIALFLEYSIKLGIAPLMTALLIPNRTRNFAASFVATYLVLSIAWPVMVAVFNMVYTNYAQLFLMWLNELEQMCNQGLFQPLQHFFPWLSLVKNPIIYDIICGIFSFVTQGYLIQAIKEVFSINYYAFWMIVYDMLLDIGIAITILVIRWVAELVEEGAGALFTMGKLG
jgi:hypothetical protein